MSNNIKSKQSKKDENQISGGGVGGRKASSLKPPKQTLKCPRCDSTNTKFCYYNNYNLTQPRHFCKSCRRYWTKGGALRNIPIGGGCRKNKKTKSSTSKFTIGDSSSETTNHGLKLFEGVSPRLMDFQLGGTNANYPPRVNLFSTSYGDNTNTHTPTNPLFMNVDPLVLPNIQEMGYTYTNLHHNTNLTTSIESMSSLNQDLHWKLQQQRLAMMFGENDLQRQQQKQTILQPILFQNLENSKQTPSSNNMGSESRKDGSSGGNGGLATEWFFDNNYASPVNVNPATTGNDTNNNWNGIQGWNHMSQYNAIPWL